MTHDPMCPIACDCEDNESGQHWLLHEKWCESCWSYCQCPLIAKVREDTLDKAIDGLQPIWERGKVLDDAVFADGWLTCFENCESTIENLRDKIC